MKEIKAYIKPHKLVEVAQALHNIKGLTGMSVNDIKGFGRGRGENEKNQIILDMIAYVPHVKLEIVCPDELAAEVVTAIEKAAHTGLRGDGKIYISNVEKAVRISTGERGDSAV